MCCPDPPPPHNESNDNSAFFAPFSPRQNQSANAVLLEFAAALERLTEGMRRTLFAGDEKWESIEDFDRRMEQFWREREQDDRELQEMRNYLAESRAKAAYTEEDEQQQSEEQTAAEQNDSDCGEFKED